MKRLLFAALLAAMTSGAVAEIGVSVSVGHPGFYGRLDIGDYPSPLLIYPQPIIVERVHPGVSHAPIYMRVPPGHAKHWAKHCYRYRACGRPVYFVQDGWYHDVYVPRYRELRGRRDHRYDERGYGYPPGHRPGRVPHGGPDFPPGPRPGYGPVYGPGPGHLPGRP